VKHRGETVPNHGFAVSEQGGDDRAASS